MSKKMGGRLGAKDTAVASKPFDSTDVDWRDSMTAGQCLSHLCLSEHLSDITFTFKDNRNVQVPAHKFVLSMRSSVFEAMFHGPMAEVGQTVMIEDIEPETMEVLLRFAYSDNAMLDGNNVLGCLYAAKKYALTGLVKQCSAFLENNIDSSNVYAIHDQAVFYDMKSLETKCFEFILENAPETLASQDFLKVSHATLIKLLKHDELAEDEVNVFDAAMRWARNDCKARNVTPDSQQMRKSLGEALFAIRFPTMAIEEFAKVVTPAGILTSEDQIMLYQYNATGGCTQLDKFSTRERSQKEITINLSDFLHNITGQCQLYELEIVDPEYLSPSDLEEPVRYNRQFGYEDEEYESRFSEDEYANKAVKSVIPRKHRKQTAKICRLGNQKIKSVTCTFAKNVKMITQNDRNISNYKIKGNKIVFLNPVEIANGRVVVSFITNLKDEAAYRNVRKKPDKKHFNTMSNRTNINQCRVNDRVINITQIPVGMEKISFVK